MINKYSLNRPIWNANIRGNKIWALPPPPLSSELLRVVLPLDLVMSPVRDLSHLESAKKITKTRKHKLIMNPVSLSVEVIRPSSSTCEEEWTHYRVLSCSANQKHLWCGRSDGIIEIWNVVPGEPLSIAKVIKTLESSVTCMVTVGPLLWTGSQDGSLVIWDTEVPTTLSPFSMTKREKKSLLLTLS